MLWHDPEDPDWVIPHIPPSPPVLMSPLPEALFDLRKQHQSTRFPATVFIITVGTLLYILIWCQLYQPPSRTAPSRTLEPTIDWSRLSLTPPAPVEGDPLNRFKPLFVRPGKPIARLVNDRVILQYNGTITSPLTSLGLEADASYKMETDDLHEYSKTLEEFVRSHFPKRASDERDPNSLINDLRTHFPMHQPLKAAPIVPKRLFQLKMIPKTKEEAHASRKALTSWMTMNKGIEVILRDEGDIKRWIHYRTAVAEHDASASVPVDQKHDYLKLQNPDSTSEDQEVSTGANGESKPKPTWTFVDLWQDTMIPSKLRTELYKYLVLALEGGIWVDQVTSCLKSVNEWGRITPLPKDWNDPALLLGVEHDASGADEWSKASRVFAVSDHTRPLEINEHVLWAARGHPVIIDALRRLYNRLNSSSKSNESNSCLTDALMNWLLVRWSTPWSDLRHTSEKGSWRVRDHREWSNVLVLSKESFSGFKEPGRLFVGLGLAGGQIWSWYGHRRREKNNSFEDYKEQSWSR
ncbi:BQ2448_4304 [Microbotryum intermedium]|uniref:BQ2448_4304 protein n=1 Tax=Microbotryum intermedium TaxID=269621 RepID=A0A238FHP9_9BASI|nr:BQ2448_4304 [Microbotryum intermedium]